MKLFAETRMQDFVDKRFSEAKNKIEDEDNEYLLNVNETEYIEFVTTKYHIDTFEILFDHITASTIEKKLSPRELNQEYGIWSTGFSETQNVQYIVLSVPFVGEKSLLGCLPTTYIRNTVEVKIIGNSIEFELMAWGKDTNTLTSEKDSELKIIKTLYGYLKNDIEDFNRKLRSEVEKTFRSRKSEVLKQLQLFASLNIPVKKAANVADTFAVPIIKKKLVVRPDAPKGNYKPEPTLDGEVYQGILKVVTEFGKAMERQPSIYDGKGEEALRDLFLMQLSPHFESATGETFNKKGKTDILIRYQDGNAFVAECKIWKGEVVYQATIDQLLSYITWRDTKSAVIIFVKNKDITNVLNQIKSATERHSCCVRFKKNHSDGRFDFEFHLPDDSSRSVQLSVLCFHLA